MRIMSPYTLKWLSGGRERNDISMLIRESCSQVYPATLSACMPWLPGLYDSRGELKAACGIQTAPQGAFYFEHYLDEPVETLLSSRITMPVERVMSAALCLWTDA